MASSLHHTRSQRGSILFMILLAVVLFAALSYAVTNSMQGGGKDSSAENAELAAAQIVQYATNLEQASNRLRLTNGTLPYQISFKRPNGTYGNSMARGTVDEIFSKEGGGVPFQEIPQNFLDSSFSGQTTYGNYWFPKIRVEGHSPNWTVLGTCWQPDSSISDNPCSEVVFVAPYIRQDICTALNRRFGITVMPTSVVNLASLISTHTGGAATGSKWLTTGWTDNAPRYSACHKGLAATATENAYVFYHVLIAR